jgi:hypothetical protein
VVAAQTMPPPRLVRPLQDGLDSLLGLRQSDGVWTARTRRLNVRWTGGAQARLTGTHSHRRLAFTCAVPAGQHHDFVFEISDQNLPAERADADRLWEATETAWHTAVPPVTAGLAPEGHPAQLA